MRIALVGAAATTTTAAGAARATTADAVFRVLATRTAAAVRLASVMARKTDSTDE